MVGAPTEIQSPRIGLVFWLGQCDKENHGWREGPPLTDSLQGCDLLEGLHPPGIFNSNKKEYCRLPPSANAIILGIGRFITTYRPLTGRAPGLLPGSGDSLTTKAFSVSTSVSVFFVRGVVHPLCSRASTGTFEDFGPPL